MYIQYNAALAITGGAVKGSSQTKLYKELGLEFLTSEDGSGDSAPFLKLKQVVNLNIFSN